MPGARIDGLFLYYEESGRGTPVLLLHGLGSSGRDWDLCAPGLAAGHRVIIPDARGHGRSDKPPGRYGVGLFAADIAALCDRLGLSRVHAVGLSMGGMIGFELALSRPDLVGSLVVINSGPDMIPRTIAARLAIARRLVCVDLFGPRGMAAILGRRLFPRREQAHLRRRFERTIGANDPDAYRRATRGLIGWSVVERLAELDCPVLVLASDRDYTPLAAKEAYVQRLRDARLVPIADSGHMSTLDQPRRVVEAVRTFLVEVEGRGAPVRGRSRALGSSAGGG